MLASAGRLQMHRLDLAKQEDVSRDSNRKICRRDAEGPRVGVECGHQVPGDDGCGNSGELIGKIEIPPTFPTSLRRAISDGSDQPTGAAADRPPIETLIQISARIGVCA